MKLLEATTEHRPALSKLWQQCFGDSAETVDLYFDCTWRPGRVAAAVEGDIPIAMAAWFPLHWNGQRGAYLYAVCTAPDWRGQGVCHALLTWLETRLAERGAAFAVLRPGEENLFRFYKTMGYETRLFSREVQLEAQPADGTLIPMIPRTYNSRRRELLPPGYLEFDDDFCVYQAAIGAAAGGGLYRIILPDAAGCAAVERYGDTLAVKELLLNRPEYLPQAGALLLEKLGAKSGWARSAPTQSSPGKPFGMIKSLRADFSAPERTYLGLAFD